MNVKTEASLVEYASSSPFPDSPGSFTPADGTSRARGGGGFATRHQESPPCQQPAANTSAILLCELSLSTAFNMPWFHTFMYSLLQTLRRVVLCGSVRVLPGPVSADRLYSFTVAEGKTILKLSPGEVRLWPHSVSSVDRVSPSVVLNV